MTVKRLIGMLKKLPPNAVVILSRDQEGNEFRPVGWLSEGTFADGEFVDADDNAPGNLAFCIWPT